MRIFDNLPELRFQSTPLMRGETGGAARRRAGPSYFNPLPSCEGRPRAGQRPAPAERISIHSPHARGDRVRSALHITPRISIHSPHTRGDEDVKAFNLENLKFQSTPLTRGETRKKIRLQPDIAFQSTPLTRGETTALPEMAATSCHFNPLPSHEGRQHKPPKIRPDLCQLTQQNHDTPLFGALQAPFCGAKPDIRGAKPTEKP